MNKKTIIIAIIVIALATGGYFYWKSTQDKVEEKVAEADVKNSNSGSGATPEPKKIMVESAYKAAWDKALADKRSDWQVSLGMDRVPAEFEYKGKKYSTKTGRAV